jgi:hypothetical protein
LVQAEDRVEHREPEDHDARAELLQRDDADDRGADEDELHQVAVLTQERVPRGLLRGLREPVRPHLGPPSLDLARSEALLRIDAEPLARLARRQSVPRDHVPARDLRRHDRRRHLE